MAQYDEDREWYDAVIIATSSVGTVGGSVDGSACADGSAYYTVRFDEDDIEQLTDESAITSRDDFDDEDGDNGDNASDNGGDDDDVGGGAGSCQDLGRGTNTAGRSSGTGPAAVAADRPVPDYPGRPRGFVPRRAC